MKRKIYGAYGSNMNIEQMKRRCPAAGVLCTGTLMDYELTFRGRSRGVANVEQRVGGCVPFLLWEITSHCEWALDRYEGYPTLYTKTLAPIVCDDGKTRTAMIYIMVERYESMPALPNDRYLDIILKGYRDNGLDNRPVFKAVERMERMLK